MGDPKDLLGSGLARQTAVIMELQRKQKEAMLRGDWDTVDKLSMEINKEAAKLADMKRTAISGGSDGKKEKQ